MIFGTSTCSFFFLSSPLVDPGIDEVVDSVVASLSIVGCSIWLRMIDVSFLASFLIISCILSL